MSRLVVLLLLTACAPEVETGEAPEDTGHAGTECGDPEVFDIEIVAKVEANGKAAPGIEVALDDRGQTGEILGTGTTGPNGTTTFSAVGVTSLDGCWGIVLDYWLVATDPDDASRTVEDDMNTELYNAIEDGSMQADVSDRPLELP